jgi:hypothetical protein
MRFALLRARARACRFLLLLLLLLLLARRARNAMDRSIYVPRSIAHLLGQRHGLALEAFADDLVGFEGGGGGRCVEKNGKRFRTRFGCKPLSHAPPCPLYEGWITSSRSFIVL